jgi:hypothetical protein
MGRGLAALLGLCGTLAALTPSPAAAQELTFDGDVTGLYPGIDTTITLRVVNPEPFEITVIAVTVAASDASASCPRSLLSFDQPGPNSRVAANTAGTIRVGVRMDRSAPDACQGAAWRLEFAGSVVESTPPAGPGGTPTVPGDPGANGGDRAGNGGGVGGVLPSTGAGVAGFVSLGAALVVVGRIIQTRTRRRS